MTQRAVLHHQKCSVSHVAFYRGDDRLLLKSLKGPKSHTNTDQFSQTANIRYKHLRYKKTKKYGDTNMKNPRRLEETNLKRFNKWEDITTNNFLNLSMAMIWAL